MNKKVIYIQKHIKFNWEKIVTWLSDTHLSFFCEGGHSMKNRFLKSTKAGYIITIFYQNSLQKQNKDLSASLQR